MHLTFKYHGELSEFFSGSDEDNVIKMDIDENESVFSIIEKYNIPREKISLVLVNGINVKHDDCDAYRFSDGDTLAVWPETS